MLVNFALRDIHQLRRFNLMQFSIQAWFSSECKHWQMFAQSKFVIVIFWNFQINLHLNLCSWTTREPTESFLLQRSANSEASKPTLQI
jgi:hypothetical protein